jgi:hypothetical protein
MKMIRFTNVHLFVSNYEPSRNTAHFLLDDLDVLISLGEVSVAWNDPVGSFTIKIQILTALKNS